MDCRKKIQRYRKSLQISKGRNKSTCYKVWRLTLLRDWPNMFFQCSPTSRPLQTFLIAFLLKPKLLSRLHSWKCWLWNAQDFAGEMSHWVRQQGGIGITWSSYSQLGPTHALETWITPPVGVRFVCTPLVSFRRFSYKDGFEEITILSPSLSCKSASLPI